MQSISVLLTSKATQDWLDEVKHQSLEAKRGSSKRIDQLVMCMKAEEQYRLVSSCLRFLEQNKKLIRVHMCQLRKLSFIKDPSLEET
ncbi:hypothetical protein E4U17_007584 [Claviceps sp. LM77 group G4]|nr:hypothetical protein E4U17_007584 [Claviceps sp. LM77 group G4]KAG6054117.1 hypothetical protein E4U33_008181 [Claviceps sp. LM78 group G4]KAG6071690.1 hypothetical protein E4U16_005945 [Claviceps sp. LM84 group G4]